MSDSTTSERIVAGGRFTLSTLNFGITLVFSIWLVFNAFNMEKITGMQTFFSDSVVQVDIMDTSPITSNYLPTNDLTTVLPHKVPTMFEEFTAPSMVHLNAVHCNFLLFSALCISSAFALTALQFPWRNQLVWCKGRLVIVHTWNFLMLILTVVVFTGTTKWSRIPTSNLFYSLGSQILGWVFQYWYMVDCTRAVIAAEEKDKVTGEETIYHITTTEMRGLIYAEFSVVMPLLLVSTLMPGAQGIDTWRVQTVFFGSGVLFTLFGLHQRYRKSLCCIDGIDTEIKSEVSGLDGLGYITYAIILAFLLTLNALGGDTFWDIPYGTSAITQCLWGRRIILIVTGLLVIETLVKTIMDRIKNIPSNADLVKEYRVKVKEYRDSIEGKTGLLPSFIGNLLITIVGSFLVKIIIFAGLVNVNNLTKV